MKRLFTPMLLVLLVLVGCQCTFAQISIGISVGFAPPAIPVYEQPMCPADGFMWTPGYWAYDDEDGYYWVPGTWVEAPQPGYLWTPGWWGWGGEAFLWHAGYWGPHVGFYGGINYGFGYTGDGYYGGRWDGNHFAYNTYVNRVNTTVIHNTYNTTINNVTVNRISYNGGNGGVVAQPTPQQQAWSREQHVPPVAAQQEHVQMARSNPQLRASVNQGRPPIAATVRPRDFTSHVQAAQQAGGVYHAPPANAAHGAPAPAAQARPAAQNYTHANEVPQHEPTPANTGNAARDQRYQQQQQKLDAREQQDHQRLEQQQERDHQRAQQQNYNQQQKAQMEQKHAQQTQRMEQRHDAQQQHVQERAAPAPRPAPAHQDDHH